MTVRTTIQIGHPALKAPNAPITDFKDPKLKQLLDDLKDTMETVDLIGIAAPQIGENYQVFITHPRKTQARAGVLDEFRIYINPVIVNFSEKQTLIYEGCGSFNSSRVGKEFGPVWRPRIITIEAHDENGHTFRLECDGILARVIQHEYDHLQGKEFTDRMKKDDLLFDKEYYLTQIRNSPAQILASKITILEYKALQTNINKLNNIDNVNIF